MFNKFFERKVKKAVVEAMKNYERTSLLQSMQKLDVKDGDIVMINYPGILPKGASEKIGEVVREILWASGITVNVMVFEEGMDVKMLRKEKTMGKDQVEEKELALIPKLSDEFLEVLAEAGRVKGWSLDYTEVAAFIRECFYLAGKVPPDLEPYE